MFTLLAFIHPKDNEDVDAHKQSEEDGFIEGNNSVEEKNVIGDQAEDKEGEITEEGLHHFFVVVLFRFVIYSLEFFLIQVSTFMSKEDSDCRNHCDTEASAS